MIVTTTSTIDGKPIQEYLGVVAGEAILGANLLKDISSNIRDIIGGRSGMYEQEVSMARDVALKDLVARAKGMGANAVVGVDVDYESIDRQDSEGRTTSSMLMVTASGTAVRVAEGSVVRDSIKILD
jgi:uncharacterized protein YbjQ (UPF0145 family)